MKYLLPLFCLLLTGCNKNEANGIFINGAFTDSQTYEDNRKLIELIELTSNKDPDALVGLIEFPCGGASGCYNLGSVIAQIIYKMGEADFIITAAKLNNEQKMDLRNLIEVGLEYGPHLNPKAENQTIQKQFPKLDKEIQTFNP